MMRHQSSRERDGGCADPFLNAPSDASQPTTIPRTTQDVHDALYGKFYRDSSGVGLRRFYLNRSIIRLVLQLIFCSVICGTRFKHFEGGVMLPTLCRLRSGGRVDRICLAVDIIDHLLHCKEVGPLPEDP